MHQTRNAYLFKLKANKKNDGVCRNLFSEQNKYTQAYKGSSPRHILIKLRCYKVDLCGGGVKDLFIFL